MLRFALTTAFTLALCACAQAPQETRATAAAWPAEAAPQPAACPAGVAAQVRCLAGRDSSGAYYLIAMPVDWNGTLVMHAHGGPLLGAPRPERVAEDLQRWAVVPQAGYAWAASSFRQGGVAVRAAAEDTERLRRIFVQHVAQPKFTVLHGQSWGASVAARGGEIYTADEVGRKPYDAVLLTSGVLGGGTRSYDFRLDLRVLYQHLCHNHPLPSEPDYPLWMGLPADSTLTNAKLAERTRECLGLGLPAAQRTPEQASRLRTLTQVLKLTESSVQGHLNWATFHFRDIAQHRSGGGNVFGNIGAKYVGSADDAALNAAVQRYRADPEAVRRFGEDTDPQGRIPVPVLTLHAVNDPVAFVELESTFRQTLQRAGTAGHLVQVFTDDHEHSFLTAPLYPAALHLLQAWVQQGTKPTPAALAARCGELQARFGPGCHVLPDYQPAPLESRVVARERP